MHVWNGGMIMRNYKVKELRINDKVASGIVRGLIYRVTFDFTPTEKESIKAIRKAASYNEKTIYR